MKTTKDLDSKIASLTAINTALNKRIIKLDKIISTQGYWIGRSEELMIKAIQSLFADLERDLEL